MIMIKKTCSTFLMLLISIALPNFVSDAESGGGGSVKDAKSAFFGYIFDVDGYAELKRPRSEAVRLDKEKHLLQSIKVGDRLRVVKSGKISIYSINENIIYEITPNTLVQISNAGLSTIKGETITTKTFPLKTPHNPLKDLFVTNSTPENSCFKAISPMNTSIDSLTPILSWEDTCQGRKDLKVTVKILSDKQVIYETETGDYSFKVLNDLLDYNKNYTWIVDGGPKGIIGYSFTTLDKETMTKSLENRSYYNLNRDNLSLRLSYMMYLRDKDLKEDYQREVLRLREEFPEISNVKILGELSSKDEASEEEDKPANEEIKTSEEDVPEE